MPRHVCMMIIAAGLLLSAGCARSDSPKGEARDDLETLVEAWEDAPTSSAKRDLQQRFLLQFALERRNLVESTPPQSMVESLAMEMVFARHVYEQGRPSLRRAWKVGNFWVLEGLSISGRQLVSDSDPDALPQLQEFRLWQDLVVHISPSGPLILVHSELREELRGIEELRIP